MLFNVGADADTVLRQAGRTFRSCVRYPCVGTGDRLQGDLRKAGRELWRQLLLGTAPEIAEVSGYQGAGTGPAGHYDGTRRFRAGNVASQSFARHAYRQQGNRLG